MTIFDAVGKNCCPLTKLVSLTLCARHSSKTRIYFINLTQSARIPRVSVTVVIPCLNEEECLEECIRRVKKAYQHEPKLEVLVADNGSTDRSVEIATANGARVVHERRRGYGAAIMRGMSEAKGDFLVMGDADNTYDFEDSVPMVERLKEGYEFAIGDRLSGQQEAGAMPWMHRHIGTPILTFILNLFYGSQVKDINCGLRAIRKEALPRLRLQSPGMEFASEMVIHAKKAKLKITEMPIRYYVRGGGEAKLRTLRDGWRHLRFILLFAPFPFFVVPALVGMAGGIFLFFHERFGYQLLGTGIFLTALQVGMFGVLAKTYLWKIDSFIVDEWFGRWMGRFRLEHGILAAVFIMLVGAFFLGQVDLSNLIRGFGFMFAGVQMFFASFLISILLFKQGQND